MTDYSQVPIIQCSYQLSLETQKLVARFPRNLRYQVGDRLASMTQLFFEGAIKANFIRDGHMRLKALEALSADLFTIRMTVRMAKDLKSISLGQYTEANLRIEDIHKQLIGWTKWTHSNLKRNVSEGQHT